MPLLAKGGRIAELRELEAWTVSDLAQRVGTTANYLTQIERGHRNAGKRLLAKIAYSLDVDVEEISEYRPRADRQDVA